MKLTVNEKLNLLEVRVRLPQRGPKDPLKSVNTFDVFSKLEDNYKIKSFKIKDTLKSSYEGEVIGYWEFVIDNEDTFPKEDTKSKKSSSSKKSQEKKSE